MAQFFGGLGGFSWGFILDLVCALLHSSASILALNELSPSLIQRSVTELLGLRRRGPICVHGISGLYVDSRLPSAPYLRSFYTTQCRRLFG